MKQSFEATTILFLTIIIFYIDYSLSVGRNPTPVEHNACRVRWAEHLKEVKRTYKDDRARVIAVNKGLDGFPCMTSCRIIFRGNQKDMDDIYTPDDVQCASGQHPRFCQKGRCVLPSKFRAGTGQQEQQNSHGSIHDDIVDE